ncbi:alpha/beta hydrolase [Frigoriglobus tundricola]|uniref:AB hydrolase-1 domain-containing protein n=1 Tax=Frigoriglobus tundricola TaxID=2774151 RepID=A0A6M5Z6H2_9BACT|nr:alpha/beta fold hydrolase [Frigoriglobus tundricola]QJX01285.1 hypothetical protein FTUN_8927 [Frigoriglobus tundricola]
MTLVGADTEVVETVRFPSGPLALEGRFCYPGAGAVYGAVALAGPHPMLGGDMDNNLVRGLSAGLARRGVATLCFNYRGVGASEGPPADVVGTLVEFWATSRTAEEAGYADDLRAATVALARFVGTGRCVGLVGYSFGCSLLHAAGADPDWPLVLVAPTVGRHDYAAFETVPNPMLVIAPDGDFAAEADRVTDWYAALRAPKRLVRGEWDAHFFRGQEERLAERVFEFLRERWEGGSCL